MSTQLRTSTLSLRSAGSAALGGFVDAARKIGEPLSDNWSTQAAI